MDKDNERLRVEGGTRTAGGNFGGGKEGGKEGGREGGRD